MDERDHRRNRPAPTAIREAIASGSAPRPPRLITSSDISAAPLRIDPDDEPSVPVNLSQADRIEHRQRQHESDLRELARGLGDLRIAHSSELTAIRHEHAGVAVALGSLVKLAERSDAREVAREEREANARERAAEREALERASERESVAAVAVRKSTGREKIALAVIGAIVTIGTAFAIGRAAASSPILPPAAAPIMRSTP
jgi:hypothetical protein